MLVDYTNINVPRITTSAFQNPFSSIASSWMPRNTTELFELCEWMYRYNGIFRAAIERIARLFYTDYRYETYEDISPKKTIKTFLESNDGFKKNMISIGIDYLLYGNSFVILYLPSKRWLYCNQCKNRFPSEKVKDLFYIGKFVGNCPVCENRQDFEHMETIDKDQNKINLIRIPPRDIEIIKNKYTGQASYIWNIDSLERQKYSSTDSAGTVLMHNTPIEILQAIFENKKIMFDQDKMLHLCQPNIAGYNIDWGMPFCLSCFPLVFYIAVLRKANEAIGMDYIIPIRILFPQNGTNAGEAIHMNHGLLMSKLQAIIDKHKMDPLTWNTAPAPIGYQVIGGEKRSLMISDDIKNSNDELLNSMGFSAELFYGTLGLQSTPMALRLLDNTFLLSLIYNEVLGWSIKKICRHLGIEHVKVTMNQLKVDDDVERRQVLFQLVSADKISDMTVLETYGLDFELEQRKKIQQQNILKKIQKEQENRMFHEQLLEQSPQGGTDQSPQAKMQLATDIAQQWISLPAEQRKSNLINVGQTDRILHDLIIGELTRMRNDIRGQAVQQATQQQ